MVLRLNDFVYILLYINPFYLCHILYASDWLGSVLELGIKLIMQVHTQMTRQYLRQLRYLLEFVTHTFYQDVLSKYGSNWKSDWKRQKVFGFGWIAYCRGLLTHVFHSTPQFLIELTRKWSNYYHTHSQDTFCINFAHNEWSGPHICLLLLFCSAQ